MHKLGDDGGKLHDITAILDAPPSASSGFEAVASCRGKTHGMTRDPIRPVIRDLRPSGITQVTALGLGNPDVLPLWFGETDLVTPPFIRKAAAQALEDGKTFYTNARGIQPLREAIAAFHKRTVGARHPASSASPCRAPP